MFAVNAGSRPMYNMLLQYGADALARDKDGESSLEYDDRERFFSADERERIKRTLARLDAGESLNEEGAQTPGTRRHSEAGTERESEVVFLNTFARSGSAVAVAGSVGVPSPALSRLNGRGEVPPDNVSMETRRLVRDMQLWFN